MEPKACIACNATGVSSKGEECVPCKGFGITWGVPYISPSQISTHADCERKWYYYAVLSAEKEDTTAAILGTHVHSALEGYYRRGDPLSFDDVGNIARQALPLLPSPHPSLMIEQKLFLPREGFVYHGKADLIDPRAKPWLLNDHKTGSNPKRYGLTVADLPYDAQALIYAGAMMYLYNQSAVDLQWLYLPTKGKGKAYPVQARLTKEHVEAQLKVLDSAALAIVKSRSILDVELTQPNGKACGKYGGCVYASRCSYIKANPLAMQISQAEIQTEPVEKFLTNQKDPIIMSGIDPNVLARIQQITGQPVATVPPQAPAPQAPVQAPPMQLPLSAEAANNPALAAVLARLQGQPTAAAQPLPTPVQQPLPEVLIAPMQATAYPVQQPAPSAPAPMPSNGATKGKYTLYIGCVPVGPDEEYYLADMIIESAARSAAQANGKSHYREIDYGKSQAALCYQLELLLRNWEKPLVSLGSREDSDAIHTLRACAARIVQAVR